jgi:hypothetical protein
MSVCVSGLNSKVLFRMRTRSPQGIRTSSPRWELLFGEAVPQIVHMGKLVVKKKNFLIWFETHTHLSPIRSFETQLLGVLSRKSSAAYEGLQGIRCENDQLCFFHSPASTRGQATR